MQKNLSSGFANNKDADQPVQMRSAFVIHLLENIISKLVTREILFFLASLFS